jgi:polysaccharide export outer membrane protein
MFNTPGVQYLRGEERLLDAISRAGGPRPDAGRNLIVSRQVDEGALPLPNAKEDPTRRRATAEIDLNRLLTGKDAAMNILLAPHDVVTASRAEMVYVLGDVARTGGFVLNDARGVSVLKALAMAGGLTKTAAGSNVRILRHDGEGGHSQEVPVNLGRIMKNRDEDLFLEPEDILYVPSSTGKRIANRTLDAAVGIGSSVAVWKSIQ